jgi:hypothetical protein
MVALDLYIKEAAAAAAVVWQIAIHAQAACAPADKIYYICYL